MLELVLKIFSVFKLLREVGGKWFSYNILDEIKRILGEEFYFTDYCKHITMYKNGHGILIVTCNIRVLDEEKFTIFKRQLDISDAKINSFFDSLSKMKQTPKSQRFSKMGFWYDADTDKSINLIKKAIQTDNNNEKILNWNFEIDKRVIKSKKNKIFYLTYALSIPGMFPIEDGKFDKTNAPTGNYQFCTSLEVETRVKKLKYILSFEKGIEVTDVPVFIETCCKKNFNDKDKPKTLRLKYINEMFYDKYEVTVPRPKFQNTISVVWDIKRDDRKEE